jgi:RHS repeat-associated protein
VELPAAIGYGTHGSQSLPFWTYPRAQDLDSDGRAELTIGGDVWTFNGTTFRRVYQFSAEDWPEASRARFADLNGDGLKDLLFPHTDFAGSHTSFHWATRQGLPSGEFGPRSDQSLLTTYDECVPDPFPPMSGTPANCPPGTRSPVMTYPLGDGREGILLVGAFAFPGTAQILPETAITRPDSLISADRAVLMSDVNGDGLLDQVAGTPAGIEVAMNTGNGFLAYRPYYGTAAARADLQLDFNGDGRPDHLDKTAPNVAGMDIRLSTGQGSVAVPSRVPPGVFATGSVGKQFRYLCTPKCAPGTPLSVCDPSKTWTTEDFIAFSCSRDNKADMCEQPWEDPIGTDFTCECAPGTTGACVTETVPAAAADYNLITTLDWNGDGLADIATMDDPNDNPATATLRIWVRNGKKPDVLKTVTTGLGAKTAIAYEPITNGDVYEAGTSCTYPSKCVTKGMWVVSEVRHDRGLSSNGAPVVNDDVVRYRYRDGRTDLKGRGFLGFAEQEVTRVVAPSAANGQVGFTESTRSVFEHAFDDGDFDTDTDQFTLTGYASLIETRWTDTAGGVNRGIRQRMTPELRRGVAGAPTSAANQKVFRVFTKRTLVEEFENSLPDPLPPIDGDSGGREYKRQNEVVRQRDNYGNLTWEEATVRWRTARNGAVETAKTESTTVFEETISPTAFSPKRFLGLAESQSTVATYRGSTSEARVTRYIYEPGDVERGISSGATSQPGGGADLELTTRYVRNQEGLPEEIKVEDTTGQRRITTIKYDSLERLYPTRVTNPVGHVTTRIFNPAVDAAVLEVDPNKIVKKSFFDGFGRPKGAKGSGRVAATLTYERRSDVEPFAITTTTLEGRSRRQVIFDRLGRQTAVQATDFDGNWVASRTTFDELGRVQSVQRPYGSSELSYDDFGRVTLTQRDDEAGVALPPQNRKLAFVQNLYEDYFQVTTIDEVNHRKTTITDGLGQLRTVRERIDQRDVTTSMEYVPFGLLWKVTTPGGTTESIYDVLGRPKTVTSPDTGMTTTFYNAFGEVRQQVDAEQRITDFLEMDNLGRPAHRRDTHGSEVLSTRFDYDTGPNGLGRLGSARSPDQVVTAMAYDARFGALERTELTIPGHNEGRPFVTETRFDDFGRVDRIAYPETGGAQPPFTVKHSYRPASEQLETVSDANDSSRVFWKANARDALGRILDESFDSGAVQSERRYQPLTGRLHTIVTNRGGTGVQNLEYDFRADGSLAYRRDRHNSFHEGFQYDDLDRLTRWYATDVHKSDTSASNWSVTWQYDPSDRGNLWRRVATDGQGIQTIAQAYDRIGNAGPHAVTGSTLWPTIFGYDRTGNVTFHPGLGTISYTPFNLPRRVEGPAGTVEYLYDAFGGRVRKHAATTGVMTLYAQGLYEQRMSAAGVEHVFMVNSADRVIAQVRRTGAGSDEVTYLYGDHVGSVDALQTGAGQAQKVKFDPFGNRLSFDGAGRPNVRLSAGGVMGSASSVTRGFTGHEMESDLGVVNMGGRIYDPRLGRVLQADPFVTAAFRSQSWNRYSYVNNSPLRYIDPSGYCFNRWDEESYDPAYDHCNRPEAIGDPSVAADHAWFENYNDTIYVVNNERFATFGEAAGFLAHLKETRLTDVAWANAALDAARKQAYEQGQVLGKTIGNLPVEIAGGTEAERAQAMAALNRIFTESAHGRMLRGMLEARSDAGVIDTRTRPLQIVITPPGGWPNKGGSFAQPGKNIIALDVAQVGMQYTTLNGTRPMSYERILAHEVAHSATGLGDVDVPYMAPDNRMSIVRYHENVIMRELGDNHDRSDYYSP